GCGKLDGMKCGSFGRNGVVGVIGVIAFAWNIDAAILQFVLIGDVMDQRAITDGKARVVLGEDLTEVLHCCKKLWRVKSLMPDYQHRMGAERTSEQFA